MALPDNAVVLADGASPSGQASSIGPSKMPISAARPSELVAFAVMATSGTRLLRMDAVRAFERELLPLADLITPNLDEAAALTGRRLRSVEGVALVRSATGDRIVAATNAARMHEVAGGPGLRWG